MNTETNNWFIRLFCSVSRWFGSLTALGLLVLAGWVVRWPLLLQVSPHYSPMTPWTAVCFILCGVALLCSQEPAGKPFVLLRFACTGIVFLLALIPFCEYLFHISIGTDTFLFADALRACMPSMPGRMSPPSVAGFLLSGIALATINTRSCRGNNPSQCFALLVGVVALLGVIGYAYGVPGFYQFSWYKPMALHTAFGFLMLSLGILFARPECGLMTVFCSDSEGGIMARRLQVFVVATPFALGWLLLLWHQYAGFNLMLGLSLLVILVIVIFTAVIWINAFSLHRMDLKRMRIEQQLRENEDKYQTIFETAGSAMAIFEEDRIISLVNTEFEKLCGFSKGDIEGRKSWEEFVSDQGDLERMREYHRLRRIEPLSAPRNYEFRFIDRYGTAKEIFMTITMIPGTTKSIASLMDITERKRIEQMKSDFVSLVSHQLKTPVAEINGYIYNLLAGIAGELTSKQREYLDEMQQISGRNYRLISDLLNVSRLERGVISMDIRPVAVRDVLEGALVDYYDRIRRQNLSLTIDGMDQELFVNVDKDKTIEAINNIFNNALKFTSQGGISIRVAVKGGAGCITISDTGAGIPAQKMAKLFTKEQMLEGAPVAGGGAGLGLYIAKQFLVLQKGAISVRSEAGKGTTFEILLPLADQ